MSDGVALRLFTKMEANRTTTHSQPVSGARVKIEISGIQSRPAVFNVYNVQCTLKVKIKKTTPPILKEDRQIYTSLAKLCVI